jgi:hypothetical protein
VVDFFIVLFKILILIYKIVRYILNFFYDKLNHNKVYNNFYFLIWIVKHN